MSLVSRVVFFELVFKFSLELSLTDMLKSKKINLQSLKKILVERGFVVKKKKNNFNLA